MFVDLHSLFPTVVATEQLRMDPLQVAAQLQTLLALRGDRTAIQILVVPGRVI